MLKWLICLTLVAILQATQAQQYAIVIKGGYVIDPKNNVHDTLDIAINDGKIARVAKFIDPHEGVQVVDARGRYVTPGLIDIHVHVFYGTDPALAYCGGTEAVVPDGFAFRSGITTVVDAGSSGWRSFPVFKQRVIDNSKTRVLAFLNIVGEGMRGGPYEQDTRDMDGKLAGLTARRYKDIIVGIKVAHFEGPEWIPVDEAVKAGTIANIPVMVDFGGSVPPLPLSELFGKRLRPGDIFTHCFGQLRTREAIVDTLTNTVKPFVREARKKGIIFDVGYGEISFAFSQAIPAMKAGFAPNSISTDIHMRTVNAAMKDLLSVSSKFLAMGMSVEEVVKAMTWNPAQEIHHEELGNLSVGSVADVAVLDLRSGSFGFFDYTGYRIVGERKLECALTIRAGKIVYDLDGIASPVTLFKTFDPALH